MRAILQPLAPRSRTWMDGRGEGPAPMSFEHWLAFAAASTVLLLIPGPTVLLVISYALIRGQKVALATVAGVAIGDFTAMSASMIGVGALLAASAALFTALKCLCAAYLVNSEEQPSELKSLIRISYAV